METKIQIEHLTLKIIQDSDPLNPRKEFDHFGRMVCSHRRYNLGDETLDGEAIRELAEDADNVCLPLFLYDHSGLTMNTRGFSCPWDSGCVGIIYANKAAIVKEFGEGSEAIEKAKACLEAEVKEYDQYLTGDVWGYVIEDESGTHLDSCWGFYGHEYAEEEGRAAAQSMLESSLAEANRI